MLSLWSDTKMSGLPLLFHFVLQVLARPIRQEKQVKTINIRKEVEWFLSADDEILHFRNPDELTKNS